MLIVPESLNQNAQSVRDLGSSADTGAMLIDYMCKRIGISDLRELNVLDFGCGVRFTEAILNKNLPIGTYTGIDVQARLIDFLQANVSDDRFRFYRVDVSNKKYNPKGMPHEDAVLPSLPARHYDVASMLSVITHQNPDEASPTFRFLRDRLKSDGHLFFSAFLHDGAEDYKELKPEKPGLMSSYSLSHLTDILRDTGFEVISVADPAPDGVPIMNSLCCRPV